MKIVNESKKSITIKELQVGENLTDTDSGEVIDFESLIKEQYIYGDCLKVVITKVFRSED